MAPRDHGSARDPDGEGPVDSAAPPWAGNARMPASNADDDQETWLLSYSDLVTLLLSVFVMLLAITTLKDQLPTTPLPPETPAVTVPAAGPSPLIVDTAREDEPSAPPDDRPRLNPDEVAVTAPERIAERWRARLAELGVPPSVGVSVQQNRVGIVIGDTILFAPGQVELTPPGHGVLRRLAPVLAAARGDIVVEGHTDATPVARGRFPSNWELSTARASSVVRRLIELGVPERRLSAVGYADTRPLAAGSDPVTLARNRRVAITIQADE